MTVLKEFVKTEGKAFCPSSGIFQKRSMDRMDAVIAIVGE